jgi:hypothetical protein
MVEGRGGARFAAETLEHLWITGQFFGKEFQGDVAAESGVLGLVNYAHTTAADALDDPKM